jgi:hypothetical protein
VTNLTLSIGRIRFRFILVLFLLAVCCDGQQQIGTFVDRMPRCQDSTSLDGSIGKAVLLGPSHWKICCRVVLSSKATMSRLQRFSSGARTSTRTSSTASFWTSFQPGSKTIASKAWRNTQRLKKRRNVSRTTDSSVQEPPTTTGANQCLTCSRQRNCFKQMSKTGNTKTRQQDSCN